MLRKLTPCSLSNMKASGFLLCHSKNVALGSRGSSEVDKMLAFLKTSIKISPINKIAKLLLNPLKYLNKYFSCRSSKCFNETSKELSSQ